MTDVVFLVVLEEGPEREDRTELVWRDFLARGEAEQQENVGEEVEGEGEEGGSGEGGSGRGRSGGGGGRRDDEGDGGVTGADVSKEMGCSEGARGSDARVEDEADAEME